MRRLATVWKKCTLGADDKGISGMDANAVWKRKALKTKVADSETAAAHAAPSKDQLLDQRVRLLATRWRTTVALRKLERGSGDKEEEEGRKSEEQEAEDEGEEDVVSTASSATVNEFLDAMRQTLVVLSSRAAEAKEVIGLHLFLAKRVAVFFVFLLVCWLPLVLVGMLGPLSFRPDSVSACMMLVACNSLGNLMLFLWSEPAAKRAIQGDVSRLRGWIGQWVEWCSCGLVKCRTTQNDIFLSERKDTVSSATGVGQ
jgi:hypothetical protein